MSLATFLVKGAPAGKMGLNLNAVMTYTKILPSPSKNLIPVQNKRLAITISKPVTYAKEKAPRLAQNRIPALPARAPGKSTLAKAFLFILNHAQPVVGKVLLSLLPAQPAKGRRARKCTTNFLSRFLQASLTAQNCASPAKERQAFLVARVAIYF